MDDPLVSVLMLNYNGRPIMNIMKESIMAIKASTYDNIEVIFVDNGSTDGSFDEISKFAMESRLSKLELIRSKVNVGFTGGNNIAYSHIHSNSKYVLLLNNDAIPYSGAIRSMVKKLENDKSVGATSGISVRYDRPVLDGSVCFVNEMYNAVGPPLQPFMGESYFREIAQTFPYGACSFIRREAIDEINDKGKIFDDELFMYVEDVLLGFKMWNRGYKVMFYPALCIRHKGGASSNSTFKVFHAIRGRAALSEALITRWKGVHDLFLKKMLVSAIIRQPAMAEKFTKAVKEGLEIGRKLRRKYDLDFYKAPYIKVDAAEVAERLLLPTRIAKREDYKDITRLIQMAQVAGQPRGRSYVK